MGSTVWFVGVLWNSLGYCLAATTAFLADGVVVETLCVRQDTGVRTAAARQLSLPAGIAWRYSLETAPDMVKS